MAKGKAVKVMLSKEEREELEEMISKGKWSARVLTRARTLLLLDERQGEKRKRADVAQALMVSPTTVSAICRRYEREGLQGALYEKRRPGRPVKITGDIEAKLIALACSKAPEGRSRWTMRLLAERLVELELVASISHVGVMKRLKKTASNPGKFRAGASQPRKAHSS